MVSNHGEMGDGGSKQTIVSVWNDYLCPWAYASRPLTAWLRSRGVDVRVRSYELHPRIGPEGRLLRPGGRLDAVYDHVASICAEEGLAFSKPPRSPNTHLVGGLAELVWAHHRDRFDAFDLAAARAHWVEHRPLDDWATLAELLTSCALDADAMEERVADGEADRLLAQSMDEALELGATATPAWRIGAMTITGLHPRAQFERWATKLLELG